MSRHINTIWFVLVALALGTVLVFPDWLTRDSIAGFLARLGPIAFVVYVLVSLTRSLLLIPATPFILAGAVSFPEWPLLVFVVSLVGIVSGGFLVFKFPSLGNYDEFLKQKYPQPIATLREKMHSKYALWFVAAWSFFPLVPTDAICYVAGITRLPFRKVALAMILGEAPIVAAYIFLGAGIGEWLRG